MRTQPLPMLLAATVALLAASAATANDGAFASGRYPNLFLTGDRTPEMVRARILTAYQQLFHGDPASQAVYYPAGTNANGPLAFILDVHNHDVRSEGLSYGMMITVQLDRRAEFDALWNWARTFTYHTHPAHPARGYFAWSVATNGVAMDEMPAPDGEEYFATALLFAAGRWGVGNGIYDYRTEAHRILTDLRHREPITGQTRKGEQTAVALFHGERKMVRFTPDTRHSEHTDPSYHLPAFYEVWARWGPESDREFWRAVASVSRDFFHRTAHPETALTPDYAHFDGTPWAAPWHPGSTNFLADAWRTAMNWAVDWSWWRADPGQRELSDRLQAFFEARGMGSYPSRYTICGRPLASGHSPGLVAMNATASLAATHPRARQFVEELWNTPVPSGRYRYYDGMLYLMALLHCAGEFKVWPAPAIQAALGTGESPDAP